MTSLKDKGNESFKKGRYLEAAELYSEALDQDSSNAVLYSNRALCFIKLEQWKEAVTDCDDGIELIENEKQNTDSKKTLVKLYHRKGLGCTGLRQFKKAIDSFSAGLELDPNNQAILQEIVKLERIEVKINSVSELSQDVRNQILGKNDSKSSETTFTKDSSTNTTSNATYTVSTKEESFKTTFTNNINFPEKPTPSNIITLIKTAENDKSSANDIFNYLLNISPSNYKPIFAVAGIDAEFLEFFVKQAIVWLEDPSHISDKSKTLDLMECFSDFQRFDLARLFCDSSEIERLVSLLSDVKDQEVFDKWGVFGY